MTVAIYLVALFALVAFLAGLATRSTDLYGMAAGFALVLVGLEFAHGDPVSAVIAGVFVVVPLSLLWFAQRRIRRTGGTR